MKASSRLALFFCLLSLLFLASCARPQAPADTGSGSPPFALTAHDEEHLTGRFLPVFLIENPREPYNLIGTPQATVAKNGAEVVSIDPTQASIYSKEQHFATEKGSYTNLIYRIHFPETPLSFFPFNLGAGNNVGLLIIVTLNGNGRPLLYTTLHTCGCYLAFVPTTYLPQDAYPENWQKNKRQCVYSQSLPGILDFSAKDLNTSKTVVHIESATHRIKDIRLADRASLVAFNTRNARLSPLESLKNLPTIGGGTTSFYEDSGGRKGYVKGSHKIWERLLISWWALDWRVGEDKEFESEQHDGPVFYTSLKPWARNASDLRNFAAFLTYWDWKF